MAMPICSQSTWGSPIPILAESLLLASVATLIISLGAILMHYRVVSIPILRSMATIGSTHLYLILSGSFFTMMLCGAILHRHEKKHHL